MPRNAKGLAAKKIEKLIRDKVEGMYPDGNGLYLRVSSTGAALWWLRYTFNSKRRKMALGPFSVLPQKGARIKAAGCQKLLNDGFDPAQVRDDAAAQARVAEARAQTFKQCAEAFIERRSDDWRNPKSASQWKASLETYVYPKIGPLPVQDIDKTLILKVLEQELPKYKGKKFWSATPETANRVRNRMEAILDWATEREYRAGENPARWRNRLSHESSNPGKLKAVKHHAAMDYKEIGDFIAALKKQDGIGVSAFEFLILTATRTAEVTGARWNEFDLAKKIWVIPANRIKAHKEHHVPLSPRAVAVLTALPKAKKPDDLVFPGRSAGKPLSKMGLLTLLKNMKRRDVTVHGFRSTFRDWCAENQWSREIAEMSLAHVGGDKVERAYRRTNLFDQRRKLMDAWAKYCAKPSVKNGGNNIVQLRA